MESEPRQNNSRITVINKDGTDGPTYVWKNQDCLFGSSPDAHIIISLDTVAEHHCMLFVCPDERVKAIDVRKETPKATSGAASIPATLPTKINGIPVYDYAYLPDRCIIDIGGRLFRFSYAPNSMWSAVTDPRVIAAPKAKEVIGSEPSRTPVATFASYKFCQLSENGTPSASASITPKSVIPQTETQRRNFLSPKKTAILSPLRSPNRILSPSGTRSAAVLSPYSATRPLSNVSGATSSTPKFIPRRGLTTQERYGPTPTRQETIKSQSPKPRISRYPVNRRRSSSLSDSSNNRSITSRRRSSLEHPVGHNLPQTPRFSRTRSSFVHSCPSKRKQVSFGPQLSPEHFDKTLPPCTPLKRGAKLPTLSSSSKKVNVSTSSETVSFVTPATHMTTHPSIMDRTPSRVSKVISLPPTPDENLMDSREKNATIPEIANVSANSISKPLRTCRANSRTSLPSHFTLGSRMKHTLASRSANASPRRPLPLSTPRAPPSTPVQPDSGIKETAIKRRSRSLSNSPISKITTFISQGAQNDSAENLSKTDKSPLTKPTWASIVKAKGGPIVHAKRLQTDVIPLKRLPRVATLKRRSNLFSKASFPATPIERYGAASSTGHALSPTPIVVKKRPTSVFKKSGTPLRRISAVAHPRVLALKRKSIRDANEGSPNILSRLTKGIRLDTLSTKNVRNVSPAKQSGTSQLSPSLRTSPRLSNRTPPLDSQTENEQKMEKSVGTINSTRTSTKNEDSNLVKNKETELTSKLEEEKASRRSETKKSISLTGARSPKTVSVTRSPRTSVSLNRTRSPRMSVSVTRSPRTSVSLTRTRSPGKSVSPDLVGIHELMKTSEVINSLSVDDVEELLTLPVSHEGKESRVSERRFEPSSVKDANFSPSGHSVFEKGEDKQSQRSNSLRLTGFRNQDRCSKSGPSPRISGIRRLLRSPKESFSPDLVGVCDLLKTPTLVEGTKRRTLSPVQSPHSNASLLGDGAETRDVSSQSKTVERNELTPVKTEKRGSVSTSSKEESFPEKRTIISRKSFLSSRKEKKSIQLMGLRNLVRSPKSRPSSRISGVRRLLRTPKAFSSPDLVGVRELMKSPPTAVSPNLEGMNDLMKTPSHTSTDQEVGKSLKSRNLRSARNVVTASTDASSSKRPRRTPRSKVAEQSIVSSTVEEHLLERSTLMCVDNRTSDVSSHVEVLSTKRNVVNVSFATTVSESVDSLENHPIRSTRVRKRQPPKTTVTRTRTQNSKTDTPLQNEMNVQAADIPISTPAPKTDVKKGVQKRKIGPIIESEETPPKMLRSTRANKVVKDVGEDIPLIGTHEMEASIEIPQNSQIEDDNEPSKVSTPKKRQRRKQIEFLKPSKEIEFTSSEVKEKHIEAKKRKTSPLREDESSQKRGRRNVNESPVAVLNESRRPRRKKADAVDTVIDFTDAAFSSHEVEPVNLNADKSPERSKVPRRRARQPHASQPTETLASSDETTADRLKLTSKDKVNEKEEPIFKPPLKKGSNMVKDSSSEIPNVATNDVDSTTGIVLTSKRNRKVISKEEKPSPEKSTRVTRNLRKK